MGINYNTKSIVNNDLVLCLDAANITSYRPGTIPGSTVDGQYFKGGEGTYTFEVPEGITQISAVCIGGGGGGAGRNINVADGGGGGGGGMAWGTIAVTPLEDLTVIVGEGGANGGFTGDGTDGQDSQLKRSSTVLLQGEGGEGGESGSNGSEGGSGGGSTGTMRDGGGSGGNGGNGGTTEETDGGGGGGAAGYEGNGGDGSGAEEGSGEDGAGGGGSGGGGNGNIDIPKYGGGVGPNGEHNPVENGEGIAGYGQPGSGGLIGQYGGGGGGIHKDATITQSGNGYGGAVRIVYKLNDNTRVYPALANVANTTYQNLVDNPYWNDLTINRLSGVVDGATYSSNDGGYFDFDGTDDKVTFPTSSIVLEEEDFTMGFWVFADDASDNGQSFISSHNGTGSADYGSWQVGTNSSKIRFTFLNVMTDSDFNVQSSSTISDDTWYYIVITRTNIGADTSDYKIYFNGELEASVTDSDDGNDMEGTTLTLGVNRDDNNYWEGGIAMAQIYKGKALSAAEVKQNFDAQKSRYGL